MVRFYVATRIENAAAARRLIEQLEAWDWRCTYDWTSHGSVRGDDTPEVRRTLRQVCAAEVRGVREADIVIALLPAGRGAHVELGIAIGHHRRPRIIVAATDESLIGTTEATTVFYHHPRIEHVVGGVDEVVAYLDGE